MSGELEYFLLRLLANDHIWMRGQENEKKLETRRHWALTSS